MIHLNPYYLFSNVVFINREKKYIYVDKKVYEHLHSVIFKKKWSTQFQRKQLKELFYKSYVEYMYDKKPVDVEQFNKDVYHIYITPKQTNAIIELSNDAVVLSKEFPYYVEENDDDGDKTWIIDPSVNNTISNYIIKGDGYELDCMTDFNHCMVESSQVRALVDFLGYGRCRSFLRRFLFEEKFSVKDDIEFEFIKICGHFASRYRLKFFNRNFDFICTWCRYIGSHKKPYVNKGTRNQAEFKCLYSDWFSFNGYLDTVKTQESNFGIGTKTLEERCFKDGKIIIYAFSDHLLFGNVPVYQNSEYCMEEIMSYVKNKIKYDDFFNHYENKYNEKISGSSGSGFSLQNSGSKLHLIIKYEEDIKAINANKIKLEKLLFDVSFQSLLDETKNMYDSLFDSIDKESVAPRINFFS